jgi:hypothetical protein
VRLEAHHALSLSTVNVRYIVVAVTDSHNISKHRTEIGTSVN